MVSRGCAHLSPFRKHRNTMPRAREAGDAEARLPNRLPPIRRRVLPHGPGGAVHNGLVLQRAAPTALAREGQAAWATASANHQCTVPALQVGCPSGHDLPVMHISPPTHHATCPADPATLHTMTHIACACALLLPTAWPMHPCKRGGGARGLGDRLRVTALCVCVHACARARVTPNHFQENHSLHYHTPHLQLCPHCSHVNWFRPSRPFLPPSLPLSFSVCV